MKQHKNHKNNTFLKFLPLTICAVFMILFLASDREITVQTVLSYTPHSPFTAAIVILLLYALKSVSFVFPIAVLQIATGHLYPTPAALFINFLGRAITLSIPYWVGRFSASDMMSGLQKNYPRLERICSKQEQRPIFISFLLRTLCFLPGDAVSLYLGAAKISFPCYLTGGILGTSLGVVLSTILGSAITEPGSPAFWFSALSMALTAAASSSFYIYDSRKKT